MLLYKVKKGFSINSLVSEFIFILQFLNKMDPFLSSYLLNNSFNQLVASVDPLSLLYLSLVQLRRVEFPVSYYLSSLVFRNRSFLSEE